MADGNFAGGDGSKENPFLIEDAHDLNAIREDIDKHYRIIKDIDLKEIEDWKAFDFNGELDGSFHTISNLKSTSGFINDLEGIVKNIFFDNHTIKKTTRYTGGVANRLDDGAIMSIKIRNGFVKGDVFTGGVVGRTASNTFCKYVSFEGTVNGYRVGGIVGSSNGSITHAYSIGKVDGENYVGGFQGQQYDSSALTSYAYASTYSRNGFHGRTDGEGNVKQGYYDNSKSSSNIKRGVAISPEDLKSVDFFVKQGWDKELTEDGTPVWIFEDGEYPKLWFEGTPTKNNKYLLRIKDTIYQPTPTGFNALGKVELTRELFEEYGSEDITDLIGFNKTVREEGKEVSENIFEFVKIPQMKEHYSDLIIK